MLKFVRFSESASLLEAYHKAYDNCDLTDIEWKFLDAVHDILQDANFDSWRRLSYRTECTVKTNRFPDTGMTTKNPNETD